MKRMITSLATAALIATSTFAADVDTSKMYGGAALGLEMLDGADAGLALILTGGLPIIEKGKAGPGSIAVEAELTYSLIESSHAYSENVNGIGVTYITEDVKYLTLAAYGAYRYDINEKFFAKGRMGLIFRSRKADESVYIPGFVTTSGSTSDNSFGIALGAQAGFNITDSLAVVGGLNAMDGAGLIHLTAGVEYHF